MPKNDIKKNFGNSVKIWRKQRGFSQEELAARAQLHRTYVCDVERGARNLSLESITRLAHALEISVSALFSAKLPDAPTNDTRKPNRCKDFVDILLVEDNTDDVELTTMAFRQARIANRIQIVSDGEEALNYLFCEGKYANRSPAKCPQLILLDLNLPKVSGTEVLRRIKADKRTRMIPVIILTISQMFSDMEECQRLGAETYLVKPVNFQRLGQVTPQLKLDWGLFKPTVVMQV